MKLYHSSNQKIGYPDISYSRNYLDFGKGFYLTTLQDQAIQYAQRFLRRNQEAWLNTYDFQFDATKWKVLKFEAYDREWLNFISRCRSGHDTTNYDIVIGGIANDKVIQTLDRYFMGELSAEQALGLLKYEKPNNQYCIRSQSLLNKCLTHIESKKL